MNDTSRFIGQTYVNKYGQKMKCIAYRDTNDIDIQFEDGTIVKHRKYYNFKHGHVKNPNGHLGEVSINSDGHKMKIIRYDNSDDVTVQFEDETIVKHKTYTNFKSGSIRNPNIHVGEKYQLRDGRIATIKKFSQYNVTIQLSDGQVVSNVGYKTLQRGSLGRNPKYEC